MDEINAKCQDILPTEAKSIDEGMYTLGIWFYTLPTVRFQKNFNILKEKITKKLNFLRSRRLSIKGRALAVNTLVLSKLWYITSIIPITRGTVNITAFTTIHKNLLKEIKNLISAYIWRNDDTPPVNCHVLNLPHDKGGLGILQIDIQGLALRAKQITEAFANKPDPLPSQIFARYHLCDLNGQLQHTQNFLPYTFFLEHYRRQRRRLPSRGGGAIIAFPKFPNYQSLMELAARAKPLYNDPDTPPTCKQIYKELFPKEVTIAGEEKWNERLLIKPDWANTWETLNNPTTKQNFWKMRHFILHSVDRIDSLRNHQNRTPRRKCLYCRTVLNMQNPPDDTHVHTFFECPMAEEVWRDVLETLYKINHQGITRQTPRNKKVLIIGIAGKGKKDTIANTIIAETISQLWKAYYKYVYNQEIPVAQTCIAATNATVKTALLDHLQIALRGPGLGDFTAKYHIPGLFDINNTGNALNFKF